MFKIAFLKNFPLGFVIGAICAFLFAAVVDSSFSAEAVKNWTYLLSALVTLLAATIALAGVFSNIENQNKLNEQRRTDDLAASKAVLPLALSQVVQAAERGFEIALEIDAFFQDRSNVEKVEKDTLISDATLSALRDCIRYADPVTRRWTAVGIARYQVARSRLLSPITDQRLVPEITKVDNACDWAIVYAVFEHLFKFSRDEHLSAPRNLELERIRFPIGSRWYTAPISRRVHDELRRIRDDHSTGDVDTFLLTQR